MAKRWKKKALRKSPLNLTSCIVHFPPSKCPVELNTAQCNEHGEKFEHHCDLIRMYFYFQDYTLMLFKVDLFINAVSQCFPGVGDTKLNLSKHTHWIF